MPSRTYTSSTSTSVTSAFEAQVWQRLEREVVGLRREAEVVFAALEAGRHIVLEGPPGTGKSTLLAAIAAVAGTGVVFVEGNAELTPARLIGHHDPAQVLQVGYRPEAFVAGPLLRAMRDGMLLYVEELNRVPEETLNVLITALAEGRVHVPRLDMQAAAPGFRVIAAMNPFDAVGTARIAQAVTDRMCRVAIPYQDEASERRIVLQQAGDTRHVGLAVGIARATRAHPDIRAGSSVRGAIDMVKVAVALQRVRGESGDCRATALDSALAAFTGRIELQDACGRGRDEIVAEIFERFYVDSAHEPDQASSAQDAGAVEQAPDGSGRVFEGPDARDAVREQGRRTRSRSELKASNAQFDVVSPEVGELAEEAFEDLRREDPDAAAALLCDLATATDVELRARARRLAARLYIRLARDGLKVDRGYRRIVSRAAIMEGDLDVDRTVERAAGRPRTAEDLVLRTWAASRRRLCLLLDQSGSMRGLGMALAAVATASVGLLADERMDCGVVAFSHDAVILQQLGQRRRPAELVDDVLSLRAGGTTNLELALHTAATQLTGGPDAWERIALVMSDCMATSGGDPLDGAAGVHQIHVLGMSGDAESMRRGRELASRGGGRFRRAASFTELSTALGELLSA